MKAFCIPLTWSNPKSLFSKARTVHPTQHETLHGVRSLVKSFGTEGRRADSKVPPSDEVYEYIVFKGACVSADGESAVTDVFRMAGSDIKELNVVEYARQHALDDPAIISVVSSAAFSCTSVIG